MADDKPLDLDVAGAGGDPSPFGGGNAQEVQVPVAQVPAAQVPVAQVPAAQAPAAPAPPLVARFACNLPGNAPIRDPKRCAAALFTRKFSGDDACGIVQCKARRFNSEDNVVQTVDEAMKKLNIKVTQNLTQRYIDAKVFLEDIVGQIQVAQKTSNVPPENMLFGYTDPILMSVIPSELNALPELYQQYVDIDEIELQKIRTNVETFIEERETYKSAYLTNQIGVNYWFCGWHTVPETKVPRKYAVAYDHLKTLKDLTTDLQEAKSIRDVITSLDGTSQEEVREILEALPEINETIYYSGNESLLRNIVELLQQNGSNELAGRVKEFLKGQFSQADSA